MAECFRANYPDTFIVLDATELCTEIRSCLALQSLLYSSYKSRTTLKDLIVISPNGSIYFVSELWSGSISDRELVIKSVMFCLSKKELCTEIRSCLALQSLLYSSYKSRTTLKDLIVISPNGSIYFVSELWSGSISDRELVIKSVMFCLSKKFLSSHSQAVLPFNYFIFILCLPSSVPC